MTFGELKHRTIRTTPRTCVAAIAVCLVVFVGSTSRAEPPNLAAGPQQQTGQFSLEAGFGKVDEDWFLTTRLGLVLGFDVPRLGCDDCSTRLQFGTQVPLRWRVIDNPPETDDTLRREDWDEVSDYFKILRFVEYGHPSEPLHARLGELGAVSLGHGTIMNSFFNVVSPDAFAFGVHTNVNTAYGGGQLVLNNVANPEIWGLRGYVRPWGFIDQDSFWHRLAIGTSIVADVDAPLRLRRNADNTIGVDASTTPEVEDSQFTGFTGIDAELALVSTDLFVVMPYTDLNIHWGQGPGYHLGTLASAQVAEPLKLSTRVEFRWLSENYLPDYIGPIYTIDRYQFSGWGTPVPAPKLRVAASQNGGSKVGYYSELSADILKIVQLTGAWSDYQGPDNSTLWLRANLRSIGPVTLGAYYYKHSFDGLDEAFDLDGALAVGEAQVMVFGPVYLRAHYSRLWRLIDDGTYETVDDWSIGAGAAFNF